MTNATSEALSAPVVLYYSEGRETYAVNAAGLIGRPAIQMKPSGGWRLTGIGTERGFMRYTFPEMIRVLLGGESLPSGGVQCLFDWDHGTHRQHGSPGLNRVWLAADHGLDRDSLLELVDRLDAERRDAEAAKRAADRAARVKAATAAPEVYRDSVYGVALHRFKRRPEGFDGQGVAFAVSWPGGASAALEYGAAMRALGESLVEAAEAATAEERERRLEA